MPSNRTKYSQEMREQTSKFIIESGRSATSVAEEMGIDTNTVFRWVRDYRRKHQMPSYAEEKGLKKQTTKKITNEKYKIKEQEKEIKKLKKELYEEKTKVDILSWVYAKKHTQRIIVFEHPLILRRILYL